MGVLTDYEPKDVLGFFEKICSMPHGSGNVGRISDYLVVFAEKRGITYRRDEDLNVIMWKEGSVGYENSAPVILQGHMDMVAVKEEGCLKDMACDGLDVEVQGDMISAAGTSLGGDDGIAVAYALALLDSDSIPHPPLEVIFTVDEEVGMLGAAAIDVSDIKGKTMLNLDSEDEGIFMVSCAGGARVHVNLPYWKEEAGNFGLKIRISGLTGGHSGCEIDKGRLNAIKAMGRLLWSANDISWKLVSVNGGSQDNVIAQFCEAEISAGEAELEEIEKKIRECAGEILTEYAAIEPDAKIEITQLRHKRHCLNAQATSALVHLLMCMPNGVQRMNPDIAGAVQTSLNAGIISSDGGRIVLTMLVRSSSESEKWDLIRRIQALAELIGASISVEGEYPGWEYKAESGLRDILVQVYERQYGKKPEIVGLHAGVECGIFARKIPGLDCVSIGPQMYDIHSPNERLSISSTARTWQLIKETLARLGA